MITEAGLRAVQALAVALVETIEAMFEGQTPPAPAAAPCSHPDEARIAVPRMGEPNAWRCARCGVASTDHSALAVKEG